MKGSKKKRYRQARNIPIGQYYEVGQPHTKPTTIFLH